MTVTREHYSDIGYDSLLVPAVRNADTNSTAVDTDGFQSVTLIAHVGASADTLNSTNKIEIEVEESDDNTTFTDVANANLTNYTTGTNAGTVAVVNSNATASTLYKVGYKGTKRYVRLVYNFSGTHSTGTVTAASATKGHPHIAPVNAST